MNNFFLKIVYSVCSGTEIFREIIKFSALKALRHLIFLAIICSLAFVLIKTSEVKHEINDLTEYFYKQFGNITVKDNGIYPGEKPDQARNLSYNFIQINYYPKLPSDKKLDINDDLNTMGYVWFPDNIFIWKKFNKTDFLIYPALVSNDPIRNKAIILNGLGLVSKDSIVSYIEKFRVNDFKDLKFLLAAQLNIPLMAFLNLKQGNINYTDISSNIFKWTAAGIFIGFFITIFFNTIIYSLLFAAVYSITNRSNLYNLKFKGFWVVAVYASFPGIIIGTIFSTANLIWLQYQTVFLIAFIVYLLAVTQKLRKINIENNLNN